jgi:flagellar basal-body rod protein FlgG
MGNKIFSEYCSSGESHYKHAGSGRIWNHRQGFLEMSNVQVVSELVNMITAQRAYEVNSKTIRVVDQLLSNGK